MQPGYLTCILLGILWIIAPYIAFYISTKTDAKRENISDHDKEYIKDVAYNTWKFFKEHTNESGNYLPPDNYQEGRANEVTYRTSSTNIGLGLLAVLSAYDLGFIEYEEYINMLDNSMKTIENLQKWNGHLYNWYDTKTLEPLNPRFISTVDSGNLVGYLYTLKGAVGEQCLRPGGCNLPLQNLSTRITKLIEETDFSVLYDSKNNLFSIGYNLDENKLVDSYYDLLASEARQTSLVAIAKKDVPSKHWNSLSRTLTCIDGYKGLVSWSGTAFEYLMPNINIKKYPGTLLDESIKFMIKNQKKYAKNLGIPWGISESAFLMQDLNYNYQYKAFGVPWLGLKRGLADEMVVSSYASIMALTEVPKDVLENMKELEKLGMSSGKYGFYESIDYTLSRLKVGERCVPVKTYMAHHQGLILLTINNFLNDNILQKRFFNNPEIKTIDILLQERMPEDMIITKENKEKVEKLKYKDYESYSDRTITKINKSINNVNVLSNNNYTVVLNDRGTGFSKYKNILVNRFKETDENEQGIFFFIKNIKSKRIWSNCHLNYLSNADKYTVNFSSEQSKITRIDGNIETVCKTIVSPTDSTEIRRLELTNIGNAEEVLEITSFLEPVLTTKEADISHPAFNNLFLRYEYLEELNVILIRRKDRHQGKKDIYMAVSLDTDDKTIGELEFEIDKEKFIGRDNFNIPKMVLESRPLSKSVGLVTEPAVVLKRSISLEPMQKAILDLSISISQEREEAIELAKKYKNRENISRAFELSKARTDVENRFIGVKSNEVEVYQKMLGYLTYHNPMKKLYNESILRSSLTQVFCQSDLWKYGISGDRPIILVKIKDSNDIEIIYELLKAYEFFRIKNIDIDLVILNQDNNIYEQYVKEAIEHAIANRQIAYLKNNGIFLLNYLELPDNDKNLFLFKANLIFDAHYGNIKSQLDDLEEEYLDSISNIGNDSTGVDLISVQSETDSNNYRPEEIENLKYFNEYGGFSNDGKEYLIKVNKQNKLPTVWSHVMANENFGTLVTESMGGFTYSENSRLNRVTAWSNNSVQDTPSEVIYIKDKEINKFWSVGANPSPDDQDYYIKYGFGYANYTHMSYGILQELDVFVARENKAKINILKIKNTMPNSRELKLIYYIKPVLRRR